MAEFRIKVLGTRGSVPIDGSDFSRYGGATSCISVEVAGQLIVFDAGSGFMLLPDTINNKNEIHILISHPHIDHLMGIMVCPLLFNPNNKINIYARKIDGRGPKEQIQTLMTNPIWPVTTDYFLSNINFITCEEYFNIGDVKVFCEDGWHPGGSTIYRLEYGEKSLVYATDYEINDFSRFRLESFAKDCSLLLCDGQYTRDELQSRRGYGHSAWEDAAELAIRCGAKNLGIIHHAPLRTDEQLDNMQSCMQDIYSGGFFTKILEEREI